MKQFTLDYLSNEVSFANFYKHCLKNIQKVFEVSHILILDNIHINKQPSDSTIPQNKIGGRGGEGVRKLFKN